MNKAGQTFADLPRGSRRRTTFGQTIIDLAPGSRLGNTTFEFLPLRGGATGLLPPLTVPPSVQDGPVAESGEETK